MKLYVCYGTWTAGQPVHAHPCGEAHKAVKEAGYEPEVIRSYGLGLAPDAVNQLTAGAAGGQGADRQLLGTGTGDRRRDRRAGLEEDHRLGAGEPRWGLSGRRGCRGCQDRYALRPG